MKAMKRVLATALAAAVVLSSATAASAAQSPTTAPKAIAQTKSVKVSGNTVKVKTTAKGTATVTAIKSTKKAVTVASTIKVNGVSYKVTVIGANAFKKCKKVKTVTIPAPEDCYVDGVIEQTDVLAKAIKVVMDEHRFNANNVAFSISSPRLATKEVLIPNVKANKIDKLVYIYLLFNFYPDPFKSFNKPLYKLLKEFSHF